MTTMKTVIRKLANNEDGAALVEYGLLVALIAVVCVTVVGTLGKTISGAFNTINSKIS